MSLDVYLDIDTPQSKPGGSGSQPMKPAVGTRLSIVPQGRHQCGQACVATIAGTTLDDAIRAVGRRGYTRIKDLDRGLRRLTDSRLRMGPRRVGLPKSGSASTWLVAVRLEPGSKNWHWALMYQAHGEVCVVWPSRGDSSERWRHEWKVTSSYEVIERE